MAVGLRFAHVTLRQAPGDRVQHKYGEADLKFRSATADDLNELHDTVVRAIDGVRVKKKVEDFVVAIRKRDFDEVVQRLKAYYE